MAESVNTRHPMLQPHYILVPLQRRFSWLSYTGYKQWYWQALDSNLADDLIVFIDQIKGGSHDLPLAGDLWMDVDVYLGTDRDAEGETDSGTWLDILCCIDIFIYIHNIEYIVAQNSSPLPMDQADDTYTINEYEEYNGDSDTSVYKLDRLDLDSHVELTSKAQKSFLNGQGKGMLPCLYA